MRTLLVAAALLLAAPAATSAVAQTPVTLTFESVPTNAAGFNPTPFTTLGGFSFENFGVLSSGSSFGTGTNAVSGTRFAYGSTTGDSYIYGAGLPFELRSAFLSFRTFDGSIATADVRVVGYGSGPSPLFARTLTLTNAAQLFRFDWGGVEEIAFETAALADGRSAVLAVDDVTLATVPEPGSLALLATGAAALGAVLRLRRRPTNG